MTQPLFFWLYIRIPTHSSLGPAGGLEAVIIEDNKVTFNCQSKLTESGFKLIGDSFQSYVLAEKYANNYYDAHCHSCTICGAFTQTSHIKGTRFSDYHGRNIVFNGYVCEQCAQGNSIVGKVISSDDYALADEFTFPYSYTDSARSDFLELYALV